MRRCQSKSGYGSCWLWSGHQGDHAVPIGDLGPSDQHPQEMWKLDATTRGGFWFVYPRRGSDWEPCYAYWDEGWVEA